MLPKVTLPPVGMRYSRMQLSTKLRAMANAPDAIILADHFWFLRDTVMRITAKATSAAMAIQVVVVTSASFLNILYLLFPHTKTRMLTHAGNGREACGFACPLPYGRMIYTGSRGPAFSPSQPLCDAPSGYAMHYNIKHRFVKEREPCCTTFSPT